MNMKKQTTAQDVWNLLADLTKKMEETNEQVKSLVQSDKAMWGSPV
jgi:hypothetical protein